MPAVITWTPTDNVTPLGSTSVDAAVNHTISLAYTPNTTEVIISCAAVFEPFAPDINTWLTLTPTFTSTSASVNVSGSVPLDIFDQYSVKYIDKGESDKTMTPITTDLGLVPDFKEVFKINNDTRTSRNVSFTTTVQLDDGTSLTKTYNFDISQDYSIISNWCSDYFANRY